MKCCSNSLPALSLTLMLLCSVAAPATAATAEQWRWDGIERIVVIPDIHGAYPEFVRLLQAAEVVDETLAWTAGKTHLVSLGDLLDRGADSRKVMDIFMRLETEALAAGGRVHVVAGNHELMNLVGDLRYVAREEFLAFVPDEPATLRNEEFEQFRQKLESPDVDVAVAREAFDRQFPPGFFGHRKAFRVGGQYGGWLTSLPAFVVINGTAFVHGGLPPIVAETPPGEFNENFKSIVRRYLQSWRELVDDGVLPNDENKEASDLARDVRASISESECLEKRAADCVDLRTSGGAAVTADVARRLDEFIALSDAPLLGTDGPLWYRGAVYCRGLFSRPILDASLANLNAHDVVVGHTPTPDSRVHLAHDNKLTMLDTGMLVSYYNGRPAALIIEEGKRVVQYLDPDERQAAVVDDMPEAFGLSDLELLDALQNGVIADIDQSFELEHVKLLHNGTEVEAILYPRDRRHSGNKELAAYTLSEMLGFEIVPVTVERNVRGNLGALQLAYPGSMSESQRHKEGVSFGGWCSMSQQFELLYVWDTLTGNAGRTADNLLYRRRKSWGGLAMATEYVQAFSAERRLPRPIASGQVKLVLRPEVQAALANLDEAMLLQKLDGLLERKSIMALLARRDALLELAKDQE